VGEWRAVKAEIANMSTEAARRTAGLLHGGKIHGADLSEDLAAVVPPESPGEIFVNRTSEFGSVFELPVLGTVLVHEGRHVEQLKGKTAGDEARKFIRANKNKLEDDADDYERKNYKWP